MALRLRGSSCAHCQRTPCNLQHCGQCKIVFYCNKNCRAADRERHQEFCREYKKLFDKMKRQEGRVRKEGYFAEYIGHFWYCSTGEEPSTRDYCRSRFVVAGRILQEGRDKNEKALLEVALSHYLELMRLCYGDSLGVRHITPIVLLELDRDQDAYDFLKWWETIDPDGAHDWGDPPENVQCGDWTYLRNEDIFEYMELSKYTSLHVLMAQILIKMRLINSLEKSQVEIEGLREAMFLSIHQYHACNDDATDLICSTVHAYLGGNLEIQKQRSFVIKYVKLMIEHNIIVVKALFNPDPLMNQEDPLYVSRGTAEQAYDVIGSCNHLFQQTEGILECIRQVLASMGITNMDYDPVFRMR